MFHRALDVRFKEGTVLELLFESGEVKSFDMSCLFSQFSQLQILTDRNVFKNGKLTGYGIIWTDECDIETETIYQEGTLVRTVSEVAGLVAANAVREARAKAEISQKDLAKLTGIDQSDISRIERGRANPSIGTLERIAKALGLKLKVEIN